MIEVIIIDLCAILLAPELKVRLTLAELDKDGLRVFVFAPLPRDSVKRALKIRGYLQQLDGLFYEELLAELTSSELRLLAAPSTLWLRTPAEVDYTKILKLLPPRRRLLPRALRMAKLLETDVAPPVTLDAASDICDFDHEDTDPYGQEDGA